MDFFSKNKGSQGFDPFAQMARGRFGFKSSARKYNLEIKDGAGFDGVVVFETVGFVGGWIGTFPAGTVGAAGLAGALAGAVLF